jgi:hypothetical protein
MASQHGQGQEEALATVSDVARLRGIALLAAAQVHQRVAGPPGGAQQYDVTAEREAVVSSAVRFAQFLRDGR